MFGGNTVWKGILIGVGVSAVGFYAYKKNEDRVDGFLRRHGMDIKQHGADYGVESKPGEGSRFWFTLPQAKDVEK